MCQNLAVDAMISIHNQGRDFPCGDRILTLLMCETKGTELC